MRRNFLLFLAILAGIILSINSVRRILAFRTNSQKVAEARARLESLGEENKKLKAELEYKKSLQFQEAEIRNKLGLAREKEAIVIVPGEQESTVDSRQSTAEIANWQKWWNLFFGS